MINIIIIMLNSLSSVNYTLKFDEDLENRLTRYKDYKPNNLSYKILFPDDKLINMT